MFKKLIILKKNSNVFELLNELSKFKSFERFFLKIELLNTNFQKFNLKKRSKILNVESLFKKTLKILNFEILFKKNVHKFWTLKVFSKILNFESLFKNSKRIFKKFKIV